MITIETLCVRLARVTPADVELWIERAWVRPEGAPGHYLFHPIDEARARLIVELRHELHIDDEALPVVLSLLDQVYLARRQMRRMRDAIQNGLEPELSKRIAGLLEQE